MALEQEFQYYLKNRAEFFKRHPGKFLVILNQNIIGVFDNEIEAIEKTSEIHPLGTFLVQKCDQGRESYTQTFHSRVAVGC